jgi:hypothetical protein
MPQTNILLLVKSNGERFYFSYDDSPASIETLLQTLGRYAADPEMNFTWWDAAVLASRVRAVVAAGGK